MEKLFLCLLFSAAVLALSRAAPAEKERVRGRRAAEKLKDLPELPAGYVPGKWEGWSAWSPCSKSCGQGQKQRTRECSTGPGQCPGSSEETHACLLIPCVNWQPWGHWTDCSTTCGMGTRSRSRFCPNYYGCEGERSQEEPCNPGPCAQYTPWQPWGQCSKPCGGGVQVRTRSCSQYGQCEDAAAREERPCNPHSCCAKWSKWSACSTTCGDGGFEKRTRRCTTELAGAGPYGYASKEEVEKRPCQPQPPCVSWSDWGQWSSCSKECGGGERTRERQCPIEGACPGEGAEAERCNEQECPKWREWAGWSICDASCGGGKKTRQRICSGGDGLCDGSDFEVADCNEFPCPEWTTWGPWNRCSASCGGGWKRRGRVCNQYNLCPGDNHEKVLCNTHECPLKSEWEEWGACSAPCGGGFRIRERSCVTDPEFCHGEALENSASCKCEEKMDQGEPCNTHDCAHWGEWAQWTSCNAPCAGGSRSRKRQCVNDKLFCVGPNKDHPSCLCEGPDSEEGTCNQHSCAEWSTWEEWGACSASCGGGARQRNRTCINDPTFCHGANANHPSCKCQGLDHSNDQCNAHPCPYWGNWSPWSECSADCAGGFKVRSRECETDPVFCQGDNLVSPACQCEGSFDEEKECNQHDCAEWAHWSAWSDCSQPCGVGGEQVRTRDCSPDPGHCYGDTLLTDPSCLCLEGIAEESRPCNERSCADVGPWGDWTPCSVTCGGGKTSRLRHCVIDETYCQGDNLLNDPASCQCAEPVMEEFEDCNLFACPFWAEWSPWSQCSTTCELGQKDRKRLCNTDAAFCTLDKLNEPECTCVGSDVELADCNEGPCFEWSSWEHWSSCSRVCGGGSRNRARQCPQPGACPGLDEETEFCNQMPCPDWGSWSPWSSCSVTCGGGQRARTRSCPLKDGCTPGEGLETESCGNDKCPIWAEWGEWSTCSRTCGEGNRVRTRVCQPIDGCLGSPEQIEPCHDQACAITTHWSAWSPCTKTCGGGVKTRSRVPCPTCPPEEEKDVCEEHTCPEWATWGDWTICSKTCGGGQRTRERICADPSGDEVPRGCVGRKVEIDPIPCNSNSCRG